jgi:hypothetical protein
VLLDGLPCSFQLVDQFWINTHSNAPVYRFSQPALDILNITVKFAELL